MALSASRTCVGGVLNHQGKAIRFASTSRVASSLQSSVTITRPYSTARPTLKKKNESVTAKGTKKDAHATHPPPKGKVIPPNQIKKTTSTAKEAAVHVAHTPSPVVDEVTLDPAQQQSQEQEEKLKEMERVLAFQHLMPTMDAWAQEVKDTQDVMIPLPVNYSRPPEAFKALQANTMNHLKNFTALSSIIAEDAIPGIYRGTSLMQRIRQLPRQLGTQSVEPDSLLTPVRTMALKLYKALNEAIADRNEKDIKKYTTAAYQAQSLELAKTFGNKTNKEGRIIWQMHSTISPVQILSLRVLEGYLAPDPPKLGNRLLVHALVKFDTEQSLEMYNSKGKPFHTALTNPKRVIDSEKSKESWRVPATRKRVTEYLVMEKRMWLQGPWQFREQIWP